MESEDFRFCSHRNPGTNMCVCIDIYTIFFSYPTCPTPPSHVLGGWGGALGGVGYEKNIVYV